MKGGSTTKAAWVVLACGASISLFLLLGRQAHRQANLGTPAVPSRERLLVVGGFNQGVYSSRVELTEIPPSGKTGPLRWTEASALPHGLQGHAAVSASGRIFIIGGMFAEHEFSRDVLVGQAGYGMPWRVAGTLPLPLSYHSALLWREYLLVVGGESVRTDSDAIYVAQITSNGMVGGFRVGGTLPSPSRGHAAVIVRGRLFVIGGHRADDPKYFTRTLSAELKSDGSLGAWEASAELPIALVHSAAVVHGENVYVLGGQDNEGGLYPDVLVGLVGMDGRIASWRKASPLPEATARVTANIIDGRLVVSGGGFGWAPPVYATVTVADFFDDGALSPWAAIGSLPEPLAFHAAVVLGVDRGDLGREHDDRR